uniref:2-methoxy-6-polyprenyl-1,4-benzoquinol methylase, mitochondrial n=1 Tax=Oryzias melastigma TaxID=30732 RepID=A0A3B3D955_ORYME
MEGAEASTRSRNGRSHGQRTPPGLTAKNTSGPGNNAARKQRRCEPTAETPPGESRERRKSAAGTSEHGGPIWKRKQTKGKLNPDNIWLRLTPPAGDIAFRFLEYIRSQQERQQRRAMSLRQTPLWRDVSDRYPDGGGAPESAVVVCDINKEMLKVGRQRADSRGVTTGLSWVVGDAEELLFNDDQFDLYTIAFGIRNVTHIDQALKEALRVLKPGGRFLCLEFSKVTNPIFSLCSTAAAVLLFLQKMCSYSRHMLEGTYQFPTPEVQNSGVSLPLPW